MSFTIADSNLADFSDAAVFVHPDATGAIDFDWTGATGGVGADAHRPDPQRPGRRAGLPLHVQRHDLELRPGRAHQLHDRRRHQRRQRLPGRHPERARSTTIGYGIQTIAPAHVGNPDNSYASVEVLAMNDIFDGSTNAAGTAIAVDLAGAERVQPAPVQPVLRQQHQHRLDDQ